MKDFKIKEWDESYKRAENYVWYPHEEIIRFVSKYIKKRIDINEFKTISVGQSILDFGCGIGRHVFYLDDMGLEPWGIDISTSALNKAKEWATTLGKNHLTERFILNSGEPPLPFNDSFFDFVVSHGVMDSMPFNLAKTNLKDISRIMKSGGLFYLDLVSGDDDNHYREYSGEELVENQHEKGTVQSYFNYNKILELIKDSAFTIKEAFHIRRESILSKGINSRYHIILEKVSE